MIFNFFKIIIISLELILILNIIIIIIIIYIYINYNNLLLNFQKNMNYFLFYKLLIN